MIDNTLQIKVKENDYQTPTEVRKDVVQCIVDYFLRYLEISKTWDFEVAYEQDFGVYVCRQSNSECLLSNDSGKRFHKEYIRVHGTEMAYAFDVLKKAGYYFYLEHDNVKKVDRYIWSKKPVIHGHTSMMEAKFVTFID